MHRRFDQPDENSEDAARGIIARRETGGARHVTASGPVREAVRALNREGTVGRGECLGGWRFSVECDRDHT